MKKQINIRRTQVFAMISVTLMILTAFTAVAYSPTPSPEKGMNAPAPDFEKASASLAELTSKFP